MVTSSSNAPAVRRMLTGNAAAAWGARLARADYLPSFPITPQTEIIETLAGWYGDGTLPGRLTMLESEHAMLTAAAAAAATGVRVFTATSSQGLLYAMESPNASGGRGLALGRIFTRDGTLVASTAQEGVVRVWAGR